MIITIPSLTLLPNIPAIYPVDKPIPLETSKEIQFDLGNIIFNYTNGLSTLPIVSVIINWGDETVDTIKYKAPLISPNSWLSLIGSHSFYNQTGNTTIALVLVDASGTKFFLNIKTEIVKQSIYNLDFELDIKKSAFTASNSSIIFNYTKENSDQNNTAIASILT